MDGSPLTATRLSRLSAWATSRGAARCAPATQLRSGSTTPRGDVGERGRRGSLRDGPRALGHPRHGARFGHGGHRRHGRRHRAPEHRTRVPRVARRRCSGSSPATRSRSPRCSSSADRSATASAAGASSSSASCGSPSPRRCARSRRTPPSLIVMRVTPGRGGGAAHPGQPGDHPGVVRRGDRGRAIGAWSGLGGVATAAGPLLGGYLIAAASWRWIFLINVPLGAARALASAPPRPRVV